MTNYDLQPRRRRAAPGLVTRWFVLNAQGQTFDGPFRTQAEANLSADLFRDRYGAEPRIVTEQITPQASTYDCEACRSLKI